ncbi:alpha/beta fold hydrolase [Haloterrigena salinisoli]|uniref:alpha/beta hydrolase n=1 Tax=Haloterrigena salinisoli TaxID=3132747 RepID=UPI0030CFB97E
MTDDRDPSATPRRAFLAGTVGTGLIGTTAAAVGDENGRGKGEGKRNRGGRKGRADGSETGPPTAHDLTMDDGHRLRVWERTTAADPAEAVIFVHGMTYGALSMFEPPVAEGFGWLPYAATQGQATFAPDMRGYGDTELPPEYDEPPEANGPPLSFEREALDILELTRWLREDRGFDRIHYVGLSGGTWRGRAVYELGDPDYATVTLAGGSFDTLEVGADPEGPAYLTQERSEFIDRWNAELPEGADRDYWIGGEEYTADEVQAAVWEAIYETNQAIGDGEASETPREGGETADEETIIAPLVVQESEYHPRQIDDPTLVIRASSDGIISRAGALNLYDAVGAIDHRKRYVEIGGGTHFVFLERKRRELFDAVRRFQTRY